MLGLLLMLTLVADTRAQAMPADTSLSARTLAYHEQQKSPVVAMLLEYVALPLGHVYAGDWRRGVLPAVVHYGGIAVLAVSLADCHDSDDDDWGLTGSSYESRVHTQVQPLS